MAKQFTHNAIHKRLPIVVVAAAAALISVWLLASSRAATLPGDINTDGKVDVVDLSILLSNYGRSATAAQGDLNASGAVDITDLSILLSNFGKTGSAHSINLTAPAEAATVTGNVPNIQAVAMGFTPAKVEFVLDGNVVRSEASPPYCLAGDDGTCFAWDSSSVANGQHTLVVKGYDAAGAVVATSPTRRFAVSNTTTSNPPLWQDRPDSPAGFVVATGNTYGGNLANWSDTPWNIYGGATVSIVADASKGKAIRSYGSPGGGAQHDGATSQRGEIEPGRNTYREGDTIWMGFDFWVSADSGVSNTWSSAMQAHNSHLNSPNWGVGVNGNGQRRLVITEPGGSSGNPEYQLGPTPSGQWTRILIGEKLAGAPGTGWVEAWRDGQNVLPRKPWNSYQQYGPNTGQRGSTLFPGATRYYKFGVYRGAHPSVMDLRYANVKLGTTKESVQ